MSSEEWDALTPDERFAFCQEVDREGGGEAIGCEHGCWIEPDGTCPHGGQSALLIEGLI
jgi:hypothetical protein